MKNNQEVIKEALERIKLEYLQNNSSLNDKPINWIGLDGKINLLYQIAVELLEVNDVIIKDIEDVATIITSNNT